MSIQQSFQNVVVLSLISTLTVFLIVLIRIVLKNRLTPVFRYYIWLIVVLWLITPIPIKSSFSVTGPLWDLIEVAEANEADIHNNENIDIAMLNQRPIVSPILNIPEINAKADASNLPHDIEAPTSPLKFNTKQLFQYTHIYAYIWLIGAMLVFAFNMLIYIIHGRSIRRYSCPAEDKITSLCRKYLHSMGLKKDVSVLWSDSSSIPLLYGALKPIIIIPSTYRGTFTDEQIGHIILHELVHYKRYDILLSWIWVMVSAIHWFNPIIWIAQRFCKIDCELSCDSGVMNLMGDDKGLDYIKTILSVLATKRYRRSIVMTAMSGNFKSTKERIGFIVNYRKGKASILLCAAAICLFAVLTIVFLTKPLDAELTVRDNPFTGKDNIAEAVSSPEHTNIIIPLNNNNSQDEIDLNEIVYNFNGHESIGRFRPDQWRYIGDKAYKFKAKILEKTIIGKDLGYQSEMNKYKLQVLESFKLTNYHDETLATGQIIEVYSDRREDCAVYEEYYEPGNECIAVIGEFSTSSRIDRGLKPFWGIVEDNFYYMKDNKTWIDGKEYDHTNDFWDEGVMSYSDFIKKYNVPEIKGIGNNENIHYIFRHIPKPLDGEYYVGFSYFRQDKKLPGWELGAYYKGKDYHIRKE